MVYERTRSVLVIFGEVESPSNSDVVGSGMSSDEGEASSGLDRMLRLGLLRGDFPDERTKSLDFFNFSLMPKETERLGRGRELEEEVAVLGDAGSPTRPLLEDGDGIEDISEVECVRVVVLIDGDSERDIGTDLGGSARWLE